MYSTRNQNKKGCKTNDQKSPKGVHEFKALLFVEM